MAAVFDQPLRLARELLSASLVCFVFAVFGLRLDQAVLSSALPRFMPTLAALLAFRDFMALPDRLEIDPTKLHNNVS